MTNLKSYKDALDLDIESTNIRELVLGERLLDERIKWEKGFPWFSLFLALAVFFWFFIPIKEHQDPAFYALISAVILTAVAFAVEQYGPLLIRFLQKDSLHKRKTAISEEIAKWQRK